MSFIIYVGLCIACGILASNKGRSGCGWFLFSFCLTPILGFIFVLVMKDMSKNFIPKM